MIARIHNIKDFYIKMFEVDLIRWAQFYLLYRIFGQLEIGVLREVIVNSNCRCSDKKIMNLFKTMEEKDLKAIFKNKDVTEVVCEFCKIKRTFSKKWWSFF